MIKSEIDAGDILADLAALREDVARLAGTLGELAQHGKQSASEQISDVVAGAQDKFADTAGRAQTRLGSVGADLEASVERNPLTAVAIAFAVGMGFGVMSRTRN